VTIEPKVSRDQPRQINHLAPDGILAKDSDDYEGLPPPGPDPSQPIQKRRSVARSLGRAVVLLYTASCCRSARFSTASWRWPPKRNGRRRSTWSKRVIIEPRFSPDQRRQINDLPPAKVLAKDSVAATECGCGTGRLRSIRRHPVAKKISEGTLRWCALSHAVLIARYVRTQFPRSNVVLKPILY
jgi:hypothetical protein